MLRKTFAEINLSCLSHNFQTLKGLQGENKFICPMVKANAYGHGAIEISKALEEDGVSYLGVALVEEGIHLREGGVKGPSILVFGNFCEDSVASILKYHLTPVISSWNHVEVFERVLASSGPLEVHIKLNTGMSRLGFSCSESRKIANYFEASQNFVVRGLCTHLAMAEDMGQENSTSKMQLKRFEEAVKVFPKEMIKHALNSEGLLSASMNEKKLGVRPGIALYGGVRHINFRPVLQWVSEVGAYQYLNPGESLSYGWTWTAKRKSIIGIVSVGYADGYRRNLSNCGKILYRGCKCPVVGTVCMDYTFVDLTDALGDGSEEIGEEVVLIGQQKDEEILANDLADWAGTISYEVLTGISQRVPRRYKR